MNKVSGILLSLFMVFSVSSVGYSSPMEKLTDCFINSCVMVECRYELTLHGTLVKGDAVLQVQGTSYRMTAGGLDSFCDGHTLWTIDNEAMEAVAEPVEDGPAGYAANPALLIMRLGDAFDVEKSSSSNGRWIYVLSAKTDCGIKKAEIVMTSAGILIQGKFSLSDGTVVKMEVISMTSSALKPASYFRPETNFGKTWVVTDLR